MPLDLYTQLGLPEGLTPWPDTLATYHADGLTPLPRQDQPLWQVLRGRQVSDAKVVVGLADGTHRSFVVNGQPLRSAGAARAGAVLTITDVTARVKVEEQLPISPCMTH